MNVFIKSIFMNAIYRGVMLKDERDKRVFNVGIESTSLHAIRPVESFILYFRQAAMTETL